MIRFRWSPFGMQIKRFHMFLIDGLFGIPSDGWFECLPLQTQANLSEQLQINSYMSGRASRRS